MTYEEMKKMRSDLSILERIKKQNEIARRSAIKIALDKKIKNKIKNEEVSVVKVDGLLD